MNVQEIKKRDSRIAELRAKFANRNGKPQIFKMQFATGEIVDAVLYDEAAARIATLTAECERLRGLEKDHRERMMVVIAWLFQNQPDVFDRGLGDYMAYLPDNRRSDSVKLRILHDGEPCDHPGCDHHMKHPCEVCGRIGARGESVCFGGAK